MDELEILYDKYRTFDHEKLLTSQVEFEDIFKEFIDDFSEIIDLLARMRNQEEFPDYYDINESTIVGAIARIVKLYKECIHLYKEKNDDILGLITRQLFETTIIVRHLIKNGIDSQRNFRIVSYKNRYQNYKKLMADEDLRNLPAGKRLLTKLQEKLERDGFAIQDLQDEQSSGSNKWKLDDKNFYQIYKDIGDEEYYSFIYGVGSDSIHGNWQEILDYHLTSKENNHYFSFLNYEESKCISIIPIIDFIIDCYTDYLQWNKCYDENIKSLFAILKHWNGVFCSVFEEKYGESADETDRS